jgi:catechol 2,3-dioxygenase-like lactoylglutathione lyase family enzyme
MDHVGIVVDDLAAATASFVELGLKLRGEGPVEGGQMDRVVGLEGVRAEIAMMETPDGHDIDAVVASLRARGTELVGDVERYEDSYRLCYVRGPEGMIVELVEQIG